MNSIKNEENPGRYKKKREDKEKHIYKKKRQIDKRQRGHRGNLQCHGLYRLRPSIKFYKIYLSKFIELSIFFFTLTYYITQ